LPPLIKKLARAEVKQIIVQILPRAPITK